MIAARRIIFVIAVPSSLRKASRVLNLVSNGINHENYSPKMRNSQHGKKETKYHKAAKPVKNSIRSTHAEEMAIDKLKKNTSRKIINLSLIVIRISPGSVPGDYTLGNSRPCAACMYKIKNSLKLGYRINKVYYSDDIGDILCYKLRDILNEKQHVSSFYRRNSIPKNLLKEFNLVEYKKKPMQPVPQ